MPFHTDPHLPLTPISLLQRGTLASHLASSLDSAALAANVAKRTTGFTPAYLKEAFLSAALDRAQSGHAELDAEFASAVMAQVEQLREHIARMKAPDRLSVMEPPRGGMGFGV